jgi:predicted phage tail protein
LKNKVLKRVVIGVGAVILFFIGSAVGSSGAEIALKDKVETYESLDKKIQDYEKKLKEISEEYEEAKEVTANLDDKKSELSDIESKLKDKKSVLDKELEEGRKEIEKQLKDVESELSSKKEELDNVKNELALSKGELQKAEGEPKTLPAGTYVIGQDIPSGRYQATPSGRGSNFVVRDSFGKLKVNTILGSGNHREPSYTFFSEEGDVIETHSSVTLTPVK